MIQSYKNIYKCVYLQLIMNFASDKKKEMRRRIGSKVMRSCLF